MSEHVARFPLTAPADLEPAQRAFYDRLLDSPRARAGDVPLTDAATGALLGPFAVMAAAPVVGDAVQELGSALRYRSSLEPVLREAAILMIAVHEQSTFEWFAHELPARRAGLRDSQLRQIKSGAIPTGLTSRQQQALETVAIMLRQRALDDAAYRIADQSLGRTALAELVWLTGYYMMLALALAVFEPAHPAMTLPRPDPTTL